MPFHQVRNAVVTYMIAEGLLHNPLLQDMAHTIKINIHSLCLYRPPFMFSPNTKENSVLDSSAKPSI